MTVSALILTYNEEVNLPNCLESLRWCDDIVVLDSFSTDGTNRIALEAGARFFQRKFDDYASQRNFGLNEIEYKYDWILMVDADEVVTTELTAEVLDTIQNTPSEIFLYRLRIKYYLMGRWIRHSSGYPTWFARLGRVGRVRVDRRVNEEMVTNGKIGFLEHHLLHFPFNKGFHWWVEKHNRYSTLEAQEMSFGKAPLPKWGNFFDLDPSIRRRAIKNIMYRLPGRPILVFLALYFIRLGFLDGAPGFTFCTLRAFYEYLIDCKVKEIGFRENA